MLKLASNTPIPEAKRIINQKKRATHKINLVPPEQYGLMDPSGTSLDHLTVIYEVFLETKATKAVLIPVLRPEAMPKGSDVPVKVRLPNFTYSTLQVPKSTTIRNLKELVAAQVAQKPEMMLMPNMGYYYLSLFESQASLTSEESTLLDILMRDCFSNHPMHTSLHLNLCIHPTQEDIVVMEGELVKLHKYRPKSTRYFILGSKSLRWQKSKDNSDKSGEISVLNMESKPGPDPLSILISADGDRDKAKVLQLYAKDLETYEKWLNALDTAVLIARTHRPRDDASAARVVRYCPKPAPRFGQSDSRSSIEITISATNNVAITIAAVDEALSAELARFDLSQLTECVTVNETEAARRDSKTAHALATNAKVISASALFASSDAGTLRTDDNSYDDSVADDQQLGALNDGSDMVFRVDDASVDTVGGTSVGVASGGVGRGGTQFGVPAPVSDGSGAGEQQGGHRGSVSSSASRGGAGGVGTGVGTRMQSMSISSHVSSVNESPRPSFGNFEPTLPIVIDNGSHMLKVGFGGYANPVCGVPAVCGVVRTAFQAASLKPRSLYLGSEAIDRRGILTLSYPIDNGTISNWDHLLSLWEYTVIQALKVIPQQHAVLLTEPPNSDAETRGKMAQLIFDHFEPPALFIAPQPMLSMFATGSTTALVVDIGEAGVRCVPVWRGQLFREATRVSTVGGRTLSTYLQRLLTECDFDLRHYSINASITSQVKETMSVVFEDSSNTNLPNKAYVLPDGKEVQIGNQRGRLCEALFSPSDVGDSSLGLHTLISQAIDAVPKEVQADLLNNIVVVGGTAAIPGMARRITKELEKLSLSCKVSVPDSPNFAAWRGGSVLTSLSSFGSHWVTREAFAEEGVRLFQ